jgi:uncharacterized protein YbaR (Trm112 family)
MTKENTNDTRLIEPTPTKELPVLVCPICNRQLVMDNSQFNQHVDECLSKVEVKAILKDQLERERSASSSSSSISKRLKKYVCNR